MPLSPSIDKKVRNSFDAQAMMGTIGACVDALDEGNQDKEPVNDTVA